MPTAPRTTRSSSQALDDEDRLIQGVFEPPSGFVLTAIARNKWVVCAFAVLIAFVGTLYGLSRDRTYTASATLQVGQVNPNSPGFYGYVQSAASLATAFSRAIDAEPVLDVIQHKLKVSPSQATARLSAEPIPTSPAFRVIATGPTGPAAVQLANVAAGALVAYEGQSNSINPEAASLLHEYQEASFDLRRAVATAAQQSRSNPGYSSALAVAEAKQNAAEIKLRALGVAYTNAIASRAPSSGLVSLVAGAAGTSNDHSAKTQQFGFIGLLAGIVIGCVAAILLEWRRITRPLVGGAEVETQRSQQV